MGQMEAMDGQRRSDPSRGDKTATLKHGETFVGIDTAKERNAVFRSCGLFCLNAMAGCAELA